MSGWLIRRFLQMILVVFGVVTLAFVFAFLVPANPARMVAGPQASPAAVATGISHETAAGQPTPGLKTRRDGRSATTRTTARRTTVTATPAK